MSLSSTTAEKLAKLNINLEITTESKYSSTTVEKLITIVVNNNLQIKVHAENYSSTTLEKFAKIGGPNITIVI